MVWSIKGAVNARVTHFAYGTEMSVPVEPLEGEKIGRTVAMGPSGPRIEGGWSQIVAKVYTFLFPLSPTLTIPSRML